MSNDGKYNRVQIVYNANHKPYLYGAMHFVSGPLENQWWDSPFVISKRREGKPEVVYGTVVRLLNRTLAPLSRMDRFVKRTREQLGESVQIPSGAQDVFLPDDTRLTQAILDEQDDLLEDIFVSTSLYLRILTEIFSNRMRRHKVPVYNYNDDVEGHVPLRKISNVLQHHRSIVVKDGYIVDLVSADEYVIVDKPQMGLKISFREYIDEVVKAVHSIRVNDLVGVLRGLTKRISAESSPKDILFLVQNLYTLGGVAVSPGDNVSGPLETVLNNVAMKTLNRARPRTRTITMSVVFRTPRFYLEPDLNSKQVRTAVEVNGKMQSYVLGYEDFFIEVAEAYGGRQLYVPDR